MILTDTFLYTDLQNYRNLALNDYTSKLHLLCLLYIIRLMFSLYSQSARYSIYTGTCVLLSSESSYSLLSNSVDNHFLFSASIVIKFITNIVNINCFYSSVLIVLRFM